MKQDKTIYETPRICVLTLISESVCAAASDYGKAGSDGNVIWDDFEY